MQDFEKRPDDNFVPRQAPTPPPYQASPQPLASFPPQQGPPHAQQAAPPYHAPQPPPYQAHYQNPHSLRYDPTPPPPKKKRAVPKVLAGTALVLACAFAGFGGSVAAIGAFNNSENSVIYRSVNSGTGADGVSTGEGKTISSIAKNSGQSVVSIVTENLITDQFTGGRVVSGAGSGVIISADGTIVTNHHVVDGARSIQVTLPDGAQHTATLVGSDAATDIAVLKISTDNLSPAVLADSGTIQVGDFCIAIGNPLGTLGGTVTDGIVSALNREINIQGIPMSLLQMSAPVSPGNSGGGLFNANGELIGIVNAKSGGQGAEGLGFAIPINTAVQVAEDLLANGYVTGRPVLGISLVPIATPEEAAFAGVGEPGLYIGQVSPGGGAEAGGLQIGDRLISLEGTEIDSSATLSKLLGEHKPGDEVTLSVSRGGQHIEAKITLQESQPNA